MNPINDISGAIVNHAVKIHQALGPGLLESVYHRILAYELRKAGFEVQTEVAIPVEWDGHVIDDSFRADRRCCMHFAGSPALKVTATGITGSGFHRKSRES